MKFGFDWPSGFREENAIYMYLAPGYGQTIPCCFFLFFINTIIQSFAANSH